MPGTGVVAPKFLETRGFAGNAFWISGLSGSGKSTIASIISSHVAEGFSTVQMVAD